jgi:hypothetical protein
LTYGCDWWDGWAPHLGYKPLIREQKNFGVHFEAPKMAPRMSGFLGTSADKHGSKIEGSELFDEQMVKVIFPLALHQFIVESDRIT